LLLPNYTSDEGVLANGREIAHFRIVVRNRKLVEF